MCAGNEPGAVSVRASGGCRERWLTGCRQRLGPTVVSVWGRLTGCCQRLWPSGGSRTFEFVKDVSGA